MLEAIFGWEGGQMASLCPARLIAERWLPNKWINCPNPERLFPHLMGKVRAKGKKSWRYHKRVFERSSPSTHSLRSS